mmetsp:Transcript_23965/g.68888  ORF Transcript_23965/g.68888 Transcript_23965/m.68888 type:complete len:579 (-) Transcript_23965:44-1780(-)
MTRVRGILKKNNTSEIFLSEAERELRGDYDGGGTAGTAGNSSRGGIIVAGRDTTGAEGSFQYGDILYGYNDDGELIEIQSPSLLEASAGDTEGGSVAGHDGAIINIPNETSVDTLKFDASFSALGQDMIGGDKDNDDSKEIGDASMSLSGLSALASTKQSQSRSVDTRSRQTLENAAGYDGNDRHRDQDVAVQSDYTARTCSSNIAAKRRTAERRAKVDMIRDATVYSGNSTPPAATQGGRDRGGNFPSREAQHRDSSASSAEGQHGKRSASTGREMNERKGQANRGKSTPRSRTMEPPMEIALPTSELQRARSTGEEPLRRYSGSRSKMIQASEVNRRNDGDCHQIEGSGRRKSSAATPCALASANAKRGDVFEKYRRKSEQISAERGGGASDSFRSVRSAASSHRSIASQYHKDAASSLRSLGSIRQDLRSSSGQRIRTSNTRTSTRASDILSPTSAGTGGSADNSFNSENSASRVSVASLSARQRDMLQGGSRRCYSSDANNSSLEEGLSAAFGDSLDSLGSRSADGSLMTDRSRRSSKTVDDGSRSFSSNISSGKRAYASSKEARMRIRDAAAR